MGFMQIVFVQLREDFRYPLLYLARKKILTLNETSLFDGPECQHLNAEQNIYKVMLFNIGVLFQSKESHT